MKREEGFVLVTVTGFVLAFAMLMTGLAQRLQQGAVQARIAETDQSLQQIAASGVEIAVGGLLTPDRNQRWLADGRSYFFAIDGQGLEIRAFDARKFVDVNRTDPAIVAHLLRQMGAAEGAIDGALEDVLRRRRPDAAITASAIEPGGAGQSREPLRPYLSVGQLLAVAKVEGATQRARELATVFSNDGRLNPTLAAPEILAGIPGISTLEVRAIIDARAKGRSESEDFRSIVQKYERFLTTERGNVYRIAVRTTIGRSLEATVVTGIDQNLPFRVLSWD